MRAKPLKILHVTFNMGIGGTEQVIRQLILAMDPQAAQHEVLCIDGQIGAIGELLREQGVQVNSLARAQGFDWPLIGKLRQIIRSGDIDVVHCHQYTPFVYGRFAAVGTRANVVLTEHGRFYPDRYRYKAVLINPILAMTTPAIVAISEATKDALARFEFMPRGRVRVIYNGVKGLIRDPQASLRIRSELSIPPDAMVFGTVSRLDPVKNQEMMIRAFHKHHAGHPQSFLLMVGDGPERQNLEQLVSKLGLDVNVVFTGFISQPSHHLAAMDVFLLSSFTEGTSMTLLEAMSLGIPAIATAVGGNGEIVVDQVTGLLTPNDDTGAFSAAITTVADDKKFASELGLNAKLRFTKYYSADAMAQQYLCQYKQLSGVH